MQENSRPLCSGRTDHLETNGPAPKVQTCPILCAISVYYLSAAALNNRHTQEMMTNKKDESKISWFPVYAIKSRVF